MTKSAFRTKRNLLELAMEAEESGDTTTLLQILESAVEHVPDEKWPEVLLDLQAHDIEVSEYAPEVPRHLGN